MTVPRFVLPLLLCWFGAVSGLHGQQDETQKNPSELEPSDIYFQAWMAVEDARAHDQEKAYQKAYEAAGSAKRYLDTVSLYHPDWKPGIVARKRKETESILAKTSAQLSENQTDDGPKLITPDAAPETGETRNLSPEDIQQASRIQDELKGTRDELAKKQNLRNAEVARLQRRLADLERERTKLASSTLTKQVKKLRNHIDLVEEEKKALAKSLYETQTELKNTRERLEGQVAELETKEKSARKVANELNAMLEKQNEVSGEVITSLREQAKTRDKELKETKKLLLVERNRSKKLAQLLDDARGEIENLASERDQLLEERDHLSDLLQLNQGDRIQRLIEQNMTLARDLRESRETVDALNASSDASDQELLKAKRDLAMAKSQIIELRQNADADMQRRINLEKRLASMHTELKARGSLAGADANLREENEMLREMAEKFLVTQKRQREQAELLIKAARDRANDDPSYEVALQQLMGEEMVLTEEQENLIRTAPVDGQFRFDANRATPEERELAGVQLQRYTTALSTAIGKAYQRGKTAVALDLCEQLLEDNPGHVPTMVNQGIIRLRMSSPEQALTSFNNAVAMQGTNRLPYLHYLLGVTHQTLEELEKARQEYEIAVTLQPGNADAHNRLGVVHARSDEIDRAREHFEMAARIDNTALEPLRNLVRLHKEQGETEAALNYYRLFLKADGSPLPELEALLSKESPNSSVEKNNDDASADEEEPPPSASAPVPTSRQ